MFKNNSHKHLENLYKIAKLKRQKKIINFLKAKKG